MDSLECDLNYMTTQRKVRRPVHNWTRAKFIVHAAALIGMSTTGFLVGGATGAAAIVVAWIAVQIACWRLLDLNAQAPLEPAEQAQPDAYADIEDIIERLDDFARERGWDLGKRFDIARMACENRTVTFDELERRYDRGIRPE